MLLREARHRKFLSIRELAAKANVSTRTIVGIEQSKSVPTFKTARKIASALEMHPADIGEFARLLEDRPWEGKEAA